MLRLAKPKPAPEWWLNPRACPLSHADTTRVSSPALPQPPPPPMLQPEAGRVSFPASHPGGWFTYAITIRASSTVLPRQAASPLTTAGGMGQGGEVITLHLCHLIANEGQDQLFPSSHPQGRLIHAPPPQHQAQPKREGTATREGQGQFCTALGHLHGPRQLPRSGMSR